MPEATSNSSGSGRPSRDGDGLLRAGHLAPANLRDRHRAATRPASRAASSETATGCGATFRNELTDALETHAADQVVVEHGTRPADAIFHGLRHRSSNRGVARPGGAARGAAAVPVRRAAAFGSSGLATRFPAATFTLRFSDAFRLCARAVDGGALKRDCSAAPPSGCSDAGLDEVVDSPRACG